MWFRENKLLLIEAEGHFSNGEKDAAEQKYLSSIESAKNHNFVNEEGLGHELFSNFLASSGDVEGSRNHMALARDCYAQWGATSILKRFQNLSLDDFYSSCGDADRSYSQTAC